MEPESPFQSPQHPGQFSAEPAARSTPPVWGWYVAYCIAMAVLYVLCTAGGVALLSLADEMAGRLNPREATQLRIQGIVLAVMGVPLTLVFGIAPFLPRRRFAWIYGFVTIGFGLTSVCCLPASIPLLIFWIKPETKAFFDA